ncbi:AP-3 complex subunit sigma-1-like [Tamandua tetradactyla]|uniref:AP-3 complex subunit sigma-1-like n=1 Tax=Tamandua tetradactyla TaxID=48850 RepID=UPI0040542913
MTKPILIFNNHGKPQLSKFYQPYVFVKTLDKCFENVCELNLIFHVDKVHSILAEMVMGRMVLETNMNEIVTQTDAQNKLEKSEAGLAGPPAHVVSAIKTMNLTEIPRNINIGDVSIKLRIDVLHPLQLELADPTS